ncbi:FMN-binding negative transcriptional regulator [Thalassotalea fonticola]|uniref:FMN-binding negative transcriptional regulator n=1 Tax=Thalassotalea fonticola TaxID=3065649 RepID=A0ABZ0GRB8_9GAMM|nr:FMN-binding negative transcriptional regulator [Colwelliaceae bacterium S1-1]
MHVPDKWQMTSIPLMQKFIADFAFGILVSNRLDASHLPMALEKSDNAFGVLKGHFAKANTHWQELDKQKVLVIFSGPHAYISPTWYASSPAVPTWNYSSVHVEGILELVDESETADDLTALITHFEPKITDDENIIPAEYRKKLAKGIQGFRIQITNMLGKEKLGQHRSVPDQLGVVAGLETSNRADCQELLSYMQSNSIGMGK